MRGLLRGLTGDAYHGVSQRDSGLPDVPPTPSSLITRLFRDRVPRISRPTQAESTQERPTCSFALMLLGILTIALGCFVLVLQPYDIIFKYKLKFADGGETFEIWREPPVDLYLKVYLFNITNAEAFLDGEDERINIEQLGPYVYKENLIHDNVTFNDNGTLTTYPKHPLVWVPEMSNGREDDILTLPNIALLSIANVFKDKSYFTRMGLNLIIRQTDSQPLVQMTAREFMFGYESPLVTLGNKFMSSWIHFDKLGLIDRMYDFDGDHSTVYTGETDVRHGGLIDTYNGERHLTHWQGDHCSKVHLASDSTKFPSFIQPEDDLLFYRKSVCRSVPLVRFGEGDVDGLKSFHYTFQDNALDNGVHNPDNKCFCRKGHCLPAGLIDVTECYYGFPIAVSYPHFYKSDPELLNVVTGSKPDKDKHESIFKIEPESGLPLHVAVRFQINMALGDISSITRVENFKDLVLPMLWTEISMQKLPDDLSTLFKLYLNVLPIVQSGAIYLLFSAGCALLLISVVKALRVRSSPRGLSMANIQAARQRRCSAYLDGKEDNRGGLAAKEMELYYSSLLSTARESDIV